MSSDDFLKGACLACGGHLEFPVAGAGQKIACPHCGETTELRAGVAPPPASFRWLWVVALLVIALLATVLATRHILNPANHHAASPPPARAAANPPVSQPPGETLRPGDTRTNDFIITAGRLETTPGSTLVYVTGKVRNLSDHQRFGVKVRFTLLDASDAVLGQATDYQAMLDPHGEWAFKAMVMESKTVATRFAGVSED